MQKRKSDNSPPEPLTIGYVSTAEQYAALSHPVREQVLHVVHTQYGRRGEGVSIREVADQLGRKQASLYRHVGTLVDAGLLLDSGTRASGGRDARSYLPFALDIRLRIPAGGGPLLDAAARYIGKTVAHAADESSAALYDERTRAGILASEERVPTVSLISTSGWLDDEQRARVREMTRELAEMFDNARKRPGTSLVGVTLAMRPVMMADGTTRSEG